MALAEILQHYDPPLGEHSAWKMFNVRPSGEIEFPHYRLDGTYLLEAKKRPAPRGQWLRAVNKQERYLGGSYTVGFHVSPDLDDLDKWSIMYRKRTAIKVLVRQIRLLATHTPEGAHESPVRMRVWVADEMWIPEK